MAKFYVYLNAYASFTAEVDAIDEDDAAEVALATFSPYSDEALADVEFGKLNVGDVESAES